MEETKPIRKVRKPHNKFPAAGRWADEVELSALYQAQFKPKQAAALLGALQAHLAERREKLLKRGG